MEINLQKELHTLKSCVNNSPIWGSQLCSIAAGNSNKGIRYFRGNDLVVVFPERTKQQRVAFLKCCILRTMQQPTPYSNNSGKEKLVICVTSGLPKFKEVSFSNSTECWSEGRARLGVFRATMVRKITQLSPSLTPTLGTFLNPKKYARKQ